MLHLKGKEPQPELEANKRALAEVEKKIANLVEAIIGGGYNPAIKAALDKAEAEKAKLEAAVKVETVLLRDMTAFLPNAASRYKQIISNLQETLQKDVEEARQHLKALIGTVKLYPNIEGNYLEAEVQYSTEGLVSLAVGEKFKIDVVAGARYGSNCKQPVRAPMLSERQCRKQNVETICFKAANSHNQRHFQAFA